MRSLVVFAAVCVASCLANPRTWIFSSVNKDKSCLVPAGFDIPRPGAIMNAESVVNAKNGAACKIEYDADAGTIRVSTDDALMDYYDEAGFILEVSEGTLTPAGVGRGAKDDTCVYGEAGQKLGNYLIFKYEPPSEGSGKAITAGATCGTYPAPKMYTTTGVVIIPAGDAPAGRRLADAQN